MSSNVGLNLRDHFAYLPPPAECLAILVGCAELVVFGLGGLTDPAAFAKGYGLKSVPSSKSAEELDDNQKTTKGLIQAVASRNIQNGFLILYFGLYHRDRTALGITILSGLVTTLADAVIVNVYGVKDLVGGHVVGVVNSLLVGGALLYWGRHDKLFK